MAETLDFSAYKIKRAIFTKVFISLPLKEWVKNWCDGGLFIVKNFYQKK